MEQVTLPEADPQTQSGAEALVLADYVTEPWYADGLQVSCEAQSCLTELMCDVYGGFYRRHEHVPISLSDKDAFEKHGSTRAVTYGELMPESFLEIMWRVGAQPGQRFYDLGAGTGKLCTLAWLMGLRATGIELSHDRWVAGCAALSAMEELGATPRSSASRQRADVLPRLGDSLDYICGSLFDLDCADADIVLLSSVMFSREMVLRIAKIVRWLKPGCRIIAAHSFTEHCYPDNFTEFREIGDCRLRCSWKENAKWYVQEVMGNPLCERRPDFLKRVDDFPSSLRRMCQCPVASM